MNVASILAGLTGVILFFAVQLILCFKAKRMAVKLIPAYIILLCVLLAMADLLGLFGYGSGFISAKGILAMMLGIAAGIALVGLAAAWIVYKICKKKQTQTDSHVSEN